MEPAVQQLAEVQECALALLAAGAAFASGPEGAPLLRFASAQGHVQLVAAMLRAGVLMAADSNGRQPIHLAAGNGHMQCVAELLAAGADVSSTDSQQSTPLHLAAAAGSADTVAALLGGGAALNALDANGKTPTMLAMEMNKEAVVEALVAAAEQAAQSTGERWRVRAGASGLGEGVEICLPACLSLLLPLHRRLPLRLSLCFPCRRAFRLPLNPCASGCQRAQLLHLHNLLCAASLHHVPALWSLGDVRRVLRQADGVHPEVPLRQPTGAVVAGGGGEMSGTPEALLLLLGLVDKSSPYERGDDLFPSLPFPADRYRLYLHHSLLDQKTP